MWQVSSSASRQRADLIGKHRSLNGVSALEVEFGGVRCRGAEIYELGASHCM